MATKKAILVVFDGFGDRCIEAFNWRTPLEAAKTPNLDRIADRGMSGTMCAVGNGVRPGSDTAHLSIFGYLDDYTGRGPLEAAGTSAMMNAGDVAWRANFGTVTKEETGEYRILDRRAGRIEDVSAFCQAISGFTEEGIEFNAYPGTAYRAAVVAHSVDGRAISANISASDAHGDSDFVQNIVPLENGDAAIRTAKAANAFIDHSYEVLAKHPANIARHAAELPEANMPLLRGSGSVPNVVPFEEKYGLRAACVAGGGLYCGIARLVGMDVLDVPGATGTVTTDLHAKAQAVRKAIENGKYDFVFLHVKATDSLAEDGDHIGKKEFIERADKELSEILHIEWLDGNECGLIITADHSTACELGKHTADPVPFVEYYRGCRRDAVSEIGERACSQGIIGRIVGADVMPEILNMLGRSDLFGA